MVKYMTGEPKSVIEAQIPYATGVMYCQLYGELQRAQAGLEPRSSLTDEVISKVMQDENNGKC